MQADEARFDGHRRLYRAVVEVGSSASVASSLEPVQELGGAEVGRSDTAAVPLIELPGTASNDVAADVVAATDLEACDRCIPGQRYRRSVYPAEREMLEPCGRIHAREEC